MGGKAVAWSVREVEATVSAYFEMLEKELESRAYNKTASRRQLLGKLDARSPGAVERKHQNISAVLRDLGLRFIDGYKPLGNRQGLLDEAVVRWLQEHPGFFDLQLQAAEEEPPPAQFVMEGPVGFDVVNTLERLSKPSLDFDWRRQLPRQIDYAAREQANRKLGRRGEEFVVSFERARLLALGRDDLAKKVEHVATSRGDGLGFDVLSYDGAGERDDERLIEVKTTRSSAYQPFYVSKTELACSQSHSDAYRLYRVFQFGRSSGTRVYERAGALDDQFVLDPVSFRTAV